jgi:hypothetical protein
VAVVNEDKKLMGVIIKGALLAALAENTRRAKRMNKDPGR